MLDKNCCYVRNCIKIYLRIFIWNTGAVRQNPPAFFTKISLFLRNRGHWFRISTLFAAQGSSFKDTRICSNKSDNHNRKLQYISIIRRNTVQNPQYPQYPQYLQYPQYPQYSQNPRYHHYPKTPQYLQNIFDQGVHYHDVLVDLVHFLEGGKIQISLKLDLCGANEVDIWNQRFRLRRNRLI